MRVKGFIKYCIFLFIILSFSTSFLNAKNSDNLLSKKFTVKPNNKYKRLFPFKQLTKRLNRWKEGILAYFDCRITNGKAEGINNKIKVIKRRSYRFHDMDYFFLKILKATGFIPNIKQVYP